MKRFVAGLIFMSPYLLVLAASIAFAYLAPCSCMRGCSPQQTPNRCLPGLTGEIAR